MNQWTESFLLSTFLLSTSMIYARFDEIAFPHILRFSSQIFSRFLATEYHPPMENITRTLGSKIPKIHHESMNRILSFIDFISMSMIYSQFVKMVVEISTEYTTSKPPSWNFRLNCKFPIVDDVRIKTKQSNTETTARSRRVEIEIVVARNQLSKHGL